jgi:hypothetical protein
MFLALERAEVRCDETVTDFKTYANDQRASPSPAPDTSDTKQAES